MNTKGLSVVIPCFNDGRFLSEAVESVLSGAEGEVEILVVDDGSTDPLTADVLDALSKQPRLRVLRRENGGPAAARNQGIEAAMYDVILALDSDNLALPAYLNKAPVMIRSGGCDVVYGDALTFGKEDGRWILDGLDLSLLVTKNRIDTCAVFSKEIWKRAGGYPQQRILGGHADWAFWLEIISVGGHFRYMEDAGFRYRMRDDSMMADFRKSQSKLLEVYEQMLPKQMAAMNFCRENGMITATTQRQMRSEILANLCYFQFSYGSLVQGYKNWILAHGLHPKYTQFTRCAVTSPVKRMLQTLGLVSP